MEHSEQQVQTTNASYWQSVLISMLAVGLVSSLMPVIFGYITIGLEPSGSMFQIFVPVIGFCFGCLVGALGGMISVWHYANTYDIVIKLGRGALIGFITGAAIAIFSTIFEQLLHLIDPSFTENIRASLINIIDSVDMPEDQKQAQIDNIASQYSTSNSFTGLLISLGGGIILFGILNLLSGMLGAKLFSKEEKL